MLSLSVVIITKNEAANLPRCLESVRWADEVLVVDSDSTDETIEIARRFGAKVVIEPWRGFGPQKAFAASSAKNDWILSLDADECVSVGLKREIEERLVSLDPESAYAIPRKSFFLGRWIEYGGWFPDRQIRLFHRGFSQWDDAPVHEKVKCRKVGRFQSHLEHYVFRDFTHQIDTNNRYSGLLAGKDIQAGKRFSLLKLVIKPPVKFLENYLWKRGFLDGLPGFIIAVNSAVSIFWRWVKIWESERNQKNAGGK